MTKPPAIAPPRESKRASAVKTVGDLMRAPQTLERFKAFAPQFLSAERLFKVATLAINQTPKLAQATPVELMRAMMGVTSLGLEINSPLGHAYLIPYERNNQITIQVIIGYQGMIELAFRSGKIKKVVAAVATERECAEKAPDGRFYFEYNMGTDDFLRHVYHPHRDENKDQGAYAWAMYEADDGINGFVVLPWSKVIRTRNGSSGYQTAQKKGEESAAFRKNPWVAEEWAMAQKTAIRQLYKIMPKSSEMARAMEMDELSERGEDLGPALDLDPGDWHTRGEPQAQETEDGDTETKEDPKPKAEPKKGAGKAKAQPKKGPAKEAGAKTGGVAVADRGSEGPEGAAQSEQAHDGDGADNQDDGEGEEEGKPEADDQDEPEGWGWEEDAI